MKRSLALAIILCFIGLALPTQSVAAAKAGLACPKLGKTEVTGGKKFTCVKFGKKLLWNKGVLTKSSTPRSDSKKEASADPKWPIPMNLPSSLEDLYEKRAGVSYAAWQRTSIAMKLNTSNVPAVEIAVGPNTKPWSNNHNEIISSVSRAFTNPQLPKKLYIFFYSFNDQTWAENRVKEIVTGDEYAQMNRDEGGALVTSNCQPNLKDCLGAKSKTIRSNDIAIALMGVSNQLGVLQIDGAQYGNLGDEEARKKGMVLAHEYFHNLQYGPMTIASELKRSDFPPKWIREGSATFFENSIINSDSYENYMNYRKKTLGGLIEREGFKEDFISDFLNQKNWANNPDWDGVSSDWSYQLGARVMEILIALKGPDSALDIYTLMSKKVGFEAGFKSAFGLTYNEAVPLIAKTIAANWSAGL